MPRAGRDGERATRSHTKTEKARSAMHVLVCILLALLRCHPAAAFPPLASDCDLECPSGEQGPVCGNDGRTYGSRCEVERVRCQGLPVQVKHEGKCATERPRCASQRALLLSSEGGGLFVPECREDGSYAEVQCHASTGYCWCVDGLGKPIRGSSTRNARPVCKGRRTNRRRSSRGRKNKKVSLESAPGCGTSDRANFNANLIDIFQSEYSRVEHAEEEPGETGTSDPLRDTQEKRVVQWKFDQLDTDGDSALHRSEVRDLRRMARRIVRPRGCARTFAKFCDLDQDRRISRAEWAVCVGVDINNEQVGRIEDFMEDQPDAIPSPKDTDSEEPWDRESHVPRLYQITPETSDGQKEVAKEEAEPQDCNSARQVALEIDRQAPGAGTYVPECTPNGDYARAQCHRSPPYCWCVHPRTGRPIRGTATQGVRPDCEAARAKHKNFKGCSLPKKQEFLDELIKSFSKEMLEDATNRSVSLDPPTAEKAARWKFAQTDANSNGVLEKREWRAFRSDRPSLEGRARRRLRKCWRNLPRFCDENTDQKIAMDEWLACTVTVRDSKSNLPRNPRRGKNPLTTILKSD